MAPGSYSKLFVLNAIRPLTLSWSMIMHLIGMPGCKTCSKSVIRLREIWEMCKSPDIPPTSTNAPYGLRALTTPLTRSPRLSSAICFSTTALRLETTSLLFSLLTSRNFNGRTCPMRSSVGSWPVRWEPGKKARRPSTKQMAPPRLTEMTSASRMASSVSRAWILSQAWRYWMRRRLTSSCPFSSSSEMISNSMSSLSATRSSSPLPSGWMRAASASGKNAEALAPMSTMMPLRSYSTHDPLTME
mmetsp:Transcript_25717/g.71863  ORF Transcript_25717/g.71863 Transcript_25717/m.71863 type:complete len:245 (-) Transcript_25717:331-1065(-)